MTPWQQELLDVFVAYREQVPLSEAVESMLLVSRSEPQYHQAFLSALDRALEAAGDRDPALIEAFESFRGALPHSEDTFARIAAEVRELRDAYASAYDI